MKRVVAAIVALCAVALASGQVNLGGHMVPRDSFIVYVMIGHCNMDGLGETLDTVSNPRLWMYYAEAKNDATGQCNQYNAGCWQLSRDPGPHGARVATPFLKRMLGRHPGCYFGVVQYSHWESIIPDTFYRESVDANYGNHYQVIVPLADTISHRATLMGVVSMLGWDDGCSGTNTVAYAANYKHMAEEMRQDLGMPNLPFITNQQERDESERAGDAVTHMGRGCNASLSLFQELVRQTDSIPRILTNARVVQSWGPYLNSGAHQFTTAGLNRWADSAVALIERNGWAPGGTGEVAPAPVAGRGMAAAGAQQRYDLAGRLLRARGPCYPAAVTGASRRSTR